jgi:hypothetical protein
MQTIVGSFGEAMEVGVPVLWEGGETVGEPITRWSLLWTAVAAVLPDALVPSLPPRSEIALAAAMTPGTLQCRWSSSSVVEAVHPDFVMGYVNPLGAASPDDADLRHQLSVLTHSALPCALVPVEGDVSTPWRMASGVLSLVRHTTVASGRAFAAAAISNGVPVRLTATRSPAPADAQLGRIPYEEADPVLLRLHEGFLRAQGLLRRVDEAPDRAVLDGLLDDEACATLRAGTNSSLNGELYPYFAEILQGISVAGLPTDDEALVDVAMTARARIVATTRSHFGLPALYMDTIHVTRRSSPPAGSTFASDTTAHHVHADNCGGMAVGDCQRSTRHCCFYRDYSAILFLGPADGGSFFFRNPDGSEESVAPACGRLVTFAAGAGNMHGVRQVRSGHRFALASWMTTNPEYRELRRNDRFLHTFYDRQPTDEAADSAAPQLALARLAHSP